MFLGNISFSFDVTEVPVVLMKRANTSLWIFKMHWWQWQNYQKCTFSNNKVTIFFKLCYLMISRYSGPYNFAQILSQIIVAKQM